MALSIVFTVKQGRAVYGLRTSFVINTVSRPKPICLYPLFLSFPSLLSHVFHLYYALEKLTEKLAAMPSLHFGYSLLIGLTIATLPIAGVRPTSWKRLLIIISGLSYPTLILTAIVATANHFILDAVAGAIVCGLAWYANGILLNLCVVEDYFLWLLRMHKPVNYTDSDTALEPGYHRSLLADDV